MQTPCQSISLSIKSILLSACVAIVTLSGCQTTTGMQTDSSPTTLPSTSPSQKAPNTVKDPAVTPRPTPTNQGTHPPPIDYEPLPNTQSPNTTATPIDNSDFKSTDTEINHLGSPTKTTPGIRNSHGLPDTATDSLLNQNKPSPAIPSNTDQLNETAPNQLMRPNPKTTQQILIERARQNTKSSSSQSATVADGNDIPAFRRLMDTGVKQLKQGQVSSARSTFTRAQRLAPQSSAVYFYLGQVALKQNQPLKAEAMARRGLVVAQDKLRKTSLWQLILKSAQRQGNQSVIKEAKSALAK